MKPLVITLHAFGPFAKRQVIDFRLLGNKTFFLIHGPTGSGKTSILDGICFALFGDSSGGERDGRQMRSHHADGDTLTEVSFDFALGADRYRVRRIPEQMRPAKRGGGETKQNQIAELWQLVSVDDQVVEQPLCAGWKDVTEAVSGLLGFESKQFRQVIMLPQGKFFEFLKSNSQEREKILQALFGTELYKRIEDHLKQSSADLLRQAERVRTQRQTLLDQAEVEHETALAARLQQQAENMAERRHAEDVAAALAKAADTALTDARQLAGRFAECDLAAAALATLQGQDPAWQARRQTLQTARRASAIQPYAEAAAELGKQFADESTRSRTLAAEAIAAGDASKLATITLDAEQQRGPETDAIVARIAALDALKDKVATLASARAEQTSATAAASKTAAGLARARQTQQVAADALKTLADRIQAHRLEAAGLDGQRQTCASLGRQLESADKLAARLAALATVGRQLEAERGALNAAAQHCLATRARRDEVRRAWVAGQAARLALELVPGQACPVCGAQDHPDPHPTPSSASAESASAADGLVGDDVLTAAEESLSRAETAQRAAERALADTQQAAAALEASAAELRTPAGEVPTAVADLLAQTAAARSALNQTEVAATACLALDAKVPAAELAVHNANAAAQLAEATDQPSQSRLQQLIGQVAERESGVPLELQDAAVLQTALAAQMMARETIRKTLDAATATAKRAQELLAQISARAEASGEAAARLGTQHAQKLADLLDRLRAAGFADEPAYRAASLADTELAELESSIQTFAASRAAALERHARSVIDTRDLLRPDIAALIAAHDGVKAALLAASNAVRDAMAAHQTTLKFVESLSRIASAYQDVEARYKVLRKVHDVASGANPQRMSFQRYVLATLLEEVLAATTTRLRVMSQGRYEIRRKLQPVDQRAAGGLDLEVYDHYTGTTRAVSTLSGGESFLASLALALGLSDVVQSYAGGIRLDAIFVDEGFGTLDPQALDIAIKALKDLQQSGRLVGIISHVAELKEWIDARLELKATPAGSIAEFQL